MNFRHLQASLIACAISCSMVSGQDSPAPVTFHDDSKQVELDNGIVNAVIDKHSASVSSMKYGKFDMMPTRGGQYYSMGGGKGYRQPGGGTYSLTSKSDDLVDIGFLQKWGGKDGQAVDIEVHYAMKRGVSGLYTYALLHHPVEYPTGGVGEWRMIWRMPKKNDRDWLMERICVDSLRNWEMPSPKDLESAEQMGIKEIIRLRRGVRAGKYDCKYDFNLEYYSTGCWGYASDKNQVGAWLVFGSHEFFNDGPTKQDLSSATGIIHVHFGRNHYAGSSTKFESGKAWNKIYGPFLMYCNSGSGVQGLWADAQKQAAKERDQWPYDWVKNPEYPSSDARGMVGGKIKITDALKPDVSAKGAWIGLAEPAPGVNWQNDSNGYQYWTKVRDDGMFLIPAVRPGKYKLYCFVDGVVDEYEQDGVEIAAGENLLEPIAWEVAHDGKSIAWEIGVPNRRATEFQGGKSYFHGYLWEDFSKVCSNPLVYTIGESVPEKDWFYAQSSYRKRRKVEAWPWEVRFKLDNPPEEGNATLVIAWASADSANMVIDLNRKNIANFKPPVQGGNALLREGIHAKYGVSRITFPAKDLRNGNNLLVLTQSRTNYAGNHVMYDYLALELP